LDMRNWLEHGRISRFHQMDKPRWTWEMSFAKVKPQKMVDLGIYSKPQKNYIEQIQFTMIFFTLFVSLLVLHFCGMVEAADRMCVETRNSTCNQKRMIGCAKTNCCNHDNQHQSTVLSFFWTEMREWIFDQKIPGMSVLQFYGHFSPINMWTLNGRNGSHVDHSPTIES
jgi:hypothetical protein